MRLASLGLCLFLAACLPGQEALAKNNNQDETARPKRGSLDLGKGPTAPNKAAEVASLNSLFGKVVETVTPGVVSITTEKKWSAQRQQFNHPFFEFFGSPEPQTPDNTPKRNIPLGGGSGFVANPDGYIFTNAHVVDEADIVKVGLDNGRTVEATIIGVDKKADVAVLKIEVKKGELQALAFGDSDKLAIGEWVLAIGNPFALQNTVTTGIVSAKSRRNQMAGDGYADFIQTDAAVNPGNSGGPLVNLKGEVIGINSSIYTRTGGYMGVSFAIPINMALKIAEDLIYDGKVTRGYLGIGIDNVSENLAGALGLPDAKGCLVREIMSGTAAEKAGLKPGDVILSADGQEVIDASHLRNLVAALSPEKTYPFVIWRDGKKQTLKIKVGAKPDDEQSLRPDSDGPSEFQLPGGGYGSRKLGLRFEDLTPETRARYGVAGPVEGALVTEIMNGSSAAENGLVEGMVITHYKRKKDRAFMPVKDAKGLFAGLKAMEGGDNIAFRIHYKGRNDLRALQAAED